MGAIIFGGLAVLSAGVAAFATSKGDRGWAGWFAAMAALNGVGAWLNL